MESIWKDIVESHWELSHMGLIVRDLDKTFEYYKSLGLVTSVLESTGEDERGPYRVEEYGKPRGPRDYAVKARIFRMGPLPFEMLQYTEDSRGPNSEFLSNKGDGIAHVAFFVDDLEAETAKLVEKGIPIVLTGKRGDWVFMHYFDTRKFGGLLLELQLKGTFG